MSSEGTTSALSEIPTEPGAAGGALARLWARLDDRLNPILVKEVRQALRGRYFRNLFWLTVVAATGISVLRILAHVPGGFDGFGSLGPTFFLANFGVLTFAVTVFVPFWAFQSMGGEWEENTYDLLVISDLRPRQLVLGKTLAAVVQALLFLSAFLPFLVSTFLLGGVDLLSIGAVIAGTMLLSAAYSLVAIAAASFGRSRLARASLAVLLIGTLLWLAAMWTFAGSQMILEPETLRDPDFWEVASIFLLVVLLGAVIAFALACVRLAHEHENRSTALRVVVTGGMVALMAYGGWMSTSTPFSLDATFLVMTLTLVIGFGTVPFLFFATEAEPLGRRVRKQVPRSRLLALLAMPFLPGGGRGVWLYFLMAVAAMVCMAIGLSALPAPRTGPTVMRFTEVAPSFVLATLGYGFVTIGLLPGIASFRIRSLRGRTGVRVAVPIAAALAVIGPAILGFLFDIRSWANFEHPLNPVHVLQWIESDNGDPEFLGLGLLWLAALLTFAVNVPRLARAVTDTLRASDERRRAESRS